MNYTIFFDGQKEAIIFTCRTVIHNFFFLMDKIQMMCLKCNLLTTTALTICMFIIYANIYIHTYRYINTYIKKHAHTEDTGLHNQYYRHWSIKFHCKCRHSKSMTSRNLLHLQRSFLFFSFFLFPF